MPRPKRVFKVTKDPFNCCHCRAQNSYSCSSHLSKLGGRDMAIWKDARQQDRLTNGEDHESTHYSEDKLTERKTLLSYSS